MNEPAVSDQIVSQQPQTDLPEALQEPAQPKSLSFMLLYTVANMVMGVGNITLGSILLPMRVANIASDNHTAIFSLILSIGAVVAVLTNPLIGMLSDRTTSSWGRRRPWIIVGGLLTVLDVILLAFASSLLLIAIGYIILQITINMFHVALSALLPDQVPVRQRATISGLSGGLGTLLGGLLGQILVARFFTGAEASFLSLAATISLMVGLFIFVLHDVALPKAYVPPFRWKQLLNTYWVNPFVYRDFALNWLARCLIFLGYTTVVTFMFYFLQDSVQYTKIFPGQTIAQGVQTFFAINVGSIIIASLVSGLLSDWLRQRKIFVIASGVIMAIGLLLYAFFPVWSMVVLATVILGTGFGIFVAVDMALASEVLPKAADRGKDIGIIHSAVFVPMILSPVIAGITLNVLHSYQALFSLLAIGTLIAALLIVRIKGVR